MAQFFVHLTQKYAEITGGNYNFVFICLYLLFQPAPVASNKLSEPIASRGWQWNSFLFQVNEETYTSKHEFFFFGPRTNTEAFRECLVKW